ncbi:MAG: hypothetical protein O2954_18875 [bacterium]|nr:hypothetical protein [bacterium]
MDKGTVLGILENYLKETKPDVDFSNLVQMQVLGVLESSLDVIELLMHLEEKLGLEAEIELDDLGPEVGRNITFAELAEKVVKYLEVKP